MSIHQNIYIGPYIKIEELPTVLKTVTITGCEKCKKNTERRHFKYCPDCGLPTTSYNEERETEISLDNFIYDLDDSLAFAIDQKNCKILIPNKTPVGSITFNDEFEEGEYKIPAQSITEFFEVYTNEISALTTIGIKYQIIVGIVVYYK